MRIGCPLKIIVKAQSKDDTSGSWAIVHTLNSHKHNRYLLSTLESTQLIDVKDAEVVAGSNVRDLIEVQAAAGVTVVSIKATMMLVDPATYITPKGISYAKDAARRCMLSSETLMELLTSALTTEQFYFKMLSDPDTHRLRYLSWSHPSSALMYRLHPDILVMDCTYKTNKYNLPLLNVVAVTAFNTILPVAQCWLSGKKENDYVWALNALHLFMIEYDINSPGIVLTDRDLAYTNAADRVFSGVPAMLSRWHMNNNFVSKTHQVLDRISVDNPAPGQSKYTNVSDTDAFLAVYFDAVDIQTEELLER